MADPSSVPSATAPTITVTANRQNTGGVSTFQPKISVVLKKTVGRRSVAGDVAAAERFTGARRTIDLTPYLGEGDVVSVSKSVREPAGMFSVSFRDQTLGGSFLDSIYGLAEPMDVVEICMARDTSPYAAKYPNGLPILMRGFVSDVRRSTAMGPNGPVRTVTVAGQDYGRILNIVRPLALAQYALTLNMTASFSLQSAYGINMNQEDIADFIADLMGKIVNTGGVSPGFLAALRAESPSSPVQLIQLELQRSTGQVAPIGTQSWRGGSIYDLMKDFGDVGAWRELYVEDRDDGPYLVYRPTPFRDIDGSYIQQIDVPPVTVKVYDDQIVSLDVGRSDANVTNFFNVTASMFQPTDAAYAQVISINSTPSPYVSNYSNCDPALYGFRSMDANTEQGLSLTGLTQAQRDQGLAGNTALISQRRSQLIAMNRDNAVLEQGEALVRGLETLKAGRYVRIIRGEGRVSADFYLPEVVHTFTVNRSYMTKLTLERGTGFVERLQTQSSPYLNELNVRGVYASAS